MGRRWLAVCWRDRAGAAALEFALVTPLLLAMIIGIAELTRWSWGAAATRDLAVRAARCIAVTPAVCDSAAAVTAAMADAAPTIAAASELTFEKADCGVRVIARGGFAGVVTPGLGETTAVACAV